MIHVSKRAAAVITAGALMAFQALAIVGAGSAAAAVTCNFNLATHTVGVTMGAPGDSTTLTVNDPSGAIEVDTVACGLADTTNTTSIVVAGSTGDEDVTIDNASGLAFPSTISWQIAMGAGTGDVLYIEEADGADGSVAVTDTGFTMDGGTGVTGGVEGIEVDGGDGDDTIDGSALTTSGPDFEAYGGDGADTLTGGADKDVLSGGLGDDTLTGGAGDDGWHVDGCAFTNVFGDCPLIEGGDGDDTLYGGAGDDDLYGDPGDDWLSGEADDDWVEGEEGSDTLYEGTAANGADMLEGDSPNVPGDVDTIDYSARTTSVAVNEGVADASGEDLNADGDASDTGEEGDTVQNFETFMTGSGSDSIAGDAGPNTLDFSASAAGVTVDVAGGTATGNGDDTFDASFDTFVGSALDDTFVSDAGGYTFTGGDGVDTVDYSAETAGVVADLSDLGPSDDSFPDGDMENAIGGSGNDDFTGNSLRNSFWGGEGDDVLDGVAGNDTFYGGAGADDMFGGTGVDLVSFADSSAGVDVDLSLGTATSADGDDTVVDIEGAIGSAFADSILGSGATNLIKSGKGDDFVRAGTGDDTVKGGGGDDTLVGGGGDDTIYGRAGNDALFGGGGTDYGNGGKGADTCKGVEIKKSC